MEEKEKFSTTWSRIKGKDSHENYAQKRRKKKRKKDFPLILNFNTPSKGRFSFLFSFSCSLCRLWKCSSPFCWFPSTTNSNCVKTDNLKLLMLEHERRKGNMKNSSAKVNYLKKNFQRISPELFTRLSKREQRRQQQTRVNINKKL